VNHKRLRDWCKKIKKTLPGTSRTTKLRNHFTGRYPEQRRSRLQNLTVVWETCWIRAPGKHPSSFLDYRTLARKLWLNRHSTKSKVIIPSPFPTQSSASQVHVLRTVCVSYHGVQMHPSLLALQSAAITTRTINLHKQGITFLLVSRIHTVCFFTHWSC
jgi:hypothetical protein